MIPLLRVEWTLLLRHRIALSTVIVAGLWAVVVAVAPPRHRVELARWAITVDVAALGFFFAPALAVIERQHGVPALLRLTRARPDAIVAARALSMVFVSLSAVLILDVVARMPDPGLRFLGAGTMAALGSLAAWWVVGTSDSFTRFVGRIPLVVGPVVAPAIADATGWWSSGWLLLSPMTAPLRAIDGRFHAAGMAWSAICVAVAWWGVRSTVVVEPAIRERPVSNANAPLERGRGPMRTLLRRDVRLLGSDGLLVALTVGLPVMFALVRLALAFGGEWLEVRGVDVASIAPIVPGFVVIHTAGIMGTVLGLALLEDRDAGVLAAISVTPLRLPGVVLVRAALMGCATAFLVIVGALVVGLAPAAGMRVLPLVAVGSCFLAILHGVTLSTLASDRVQGVGLMKILALPLYAPLAMWFLPFPAEIPLLLIPSAWPLSVWWARSPTVAMAWTLGGVALSLSMTAMLVRRMGRTMGV